jgi:hypothetical protein
VLFRITEIYEFASRLVQKTALAGSVSISIELIDVGSRILTALDFSPAWWGYYPAMATSLAHTVDVQIDRLNGGAAELAVEEAAWFFHGFKWNDPNRAVLQNDQQKLFVPQAVMASWSAVSTCMFGLGELSEVLFSTPRIAHLAHHHAACVPKGVLNTRV